MKRALFFVSLILCFPLYSNAQAWSGIIASSRAIDWTQAGIPGGIPNRTTTCATINASTYGNGSSDATSGIQSALNSCPANQVVVLSAGTFLINSYLRIPSNVVLRGAGADQTILNLKGTQGGAAIQFGPGSPTPNGNSPISITGGATQGSTSVTLSSGSGISAGMLMVISQNDTSYMTEAGDNGACTWCTGGVGGDSGQTVEVTSVSGNTVSFRPALYMDYSPNSPVAFPFSAGCQNAGLEDLQLYANNTGYGENILMSSVKYSWVSGVESNFADGDHMWISWSMGNDVLNNFFHDGFSHSPGSHDDDLDLNYKSSANLVSNNIFYRQHVSVMLEWGTSGNVVSYNYTTGNYHSPQLSWMISDFDFHGAHPMYNLFEGNVGDHFQPDSTWGSSSNSTLFRNWFTGSRQYVPPADTRGPLQFSNAQWEDSNNMAYSIDYLSEYNNFVGNISSSAHLDSLGVVTSDFYTGTPTSVGTGCWRIGYQAGNGSYENNNAFSTAFMHGNYGCVSKTFQWAAGVTQTLPASFYLSSQPSWWGSAPWPAIGPDVTGGSGEGGHAYPIPAQACFSSAALNSDNEPVFNAAKCYPGGGDPPAAPTGLAASAH